MFGSGADTILSKCLVDGSITDLAAFGEVL